MQRANCLAAAFAALTSLAQAVPEAGPTAMTSLNSNDTFVSRADSTWTPCKQYCPPDNERRCCVPLDHPAVSMEVDISHDLRRAVHSAKYSVAGEMLIISVTDTDSMVASTAASTMFVRNGRQADSHEVSPTGTGAAQASIVAKSHNRRAEKHEIFPTNTYAPWAPWPSPEWETGRRRPPPKKVVRTKTVTVEQTVTEIEVVTKAALYGTNVASTRTVTEWERETEIETVYRYQTIRVPYLYPVTRFVPTTVAKVMPSTVTRVYVQPSEVPVPVYKTRTRTVQPKPTRTTVTHQHIITTTYLYPTTTKWRTMTAPGAPFSTIVLPVPTKVYSPTHRTIKLVTTRTTPLHVHTRTTVNFHPTATQWLTLTYPSSYPASIDTVTIDLGTVKFQQTTATRLQIHTVTSIAQQSQAPSFSYWSGVSVPYPTPVPHHSTVTLPVVHLSTALGEATATVDINKHYTFDDNHARTISGGKVSTVVAAIGGSTYTAVP